MPDTLSLYSPQPPLPAHIEQLPFTKLTTAPEGLALIYQDGILGLKDFSEPKTGAVYVDFTSDALQYRAKRGSIKNEAIAKAVGLKGGQPWHVIDATAGLGRDAFMLFSLGAGMTLMERSPHVAALLQDGIWRASQSELLASDFSTQFQFLSGQASELLNNWQGEAPNAIYLDPMFPHKKKSARVKKEMRLFQQLVGPDEDADRLLSPALALAKNRVVVKRPDYAPFLADKSPSMQIKSKKHRFDVYLTHNA